MGSNMAEAHPVAFRWPMKAKEKGATLIHVDPRYTRMSALCDVHVGIRAGSDIAFLGGLVNYVLSHDRWFKDYVLNYTNASTIVQEGFRDTEDLDGLFSGYHGNRKTGTYDPRAGRWGYARAEVEELDEWSGTSPMYRMLRQALGMHGHSLESGASSHSGARQEMTTVAEGGPPSDPTLQHPRCVFQILKRHFARYTPEMVSQVCGCAPEELVRVAELLVRQLRPGADQRRGLRAGMDPAHDRRADDPHRRHSAASARQHGQAGWWHHGDAGPLHHPGLDRSGDAVRRAAGLPAAAVRRGGARDPRLLRPAGGAAHRVLGQLPQVHRQPAQGLVRRRRDAGERLRLLLAPARGCRLFAAALLRSHVQG